MYYVSFFMFCYFSVVFSCCVCVHFVFSCYGHHRDLLSLTHSFPPRRSSYLMERLAPGRRKQAGRQPVHRPRSHPTGARAAGSCASRRSAATRSEEHTSELQSLMRNSYAVFCLKKKKTTITNHHKKKNTNNKYHNTQTNMTIT